VQSTWGSRHAIETPSNGDIPSLVQEYQGIEITCSDCHGSENPANAMGIHGSRVRHILDSEYTSTDGEEESPTTYALCYSCHDRDAVLTSTRFPDHQRHVVDQRISCSSCHDPHGSMANRALIRFGEGLGRIGFGPSVSTEVLAFESNGPGTGSCYLTCHGYDHNGIEPTDPVARVREAASRIADPLKQDSCQVRGEELVCSMRSPPRRAPDLSGPGYEVGSKQASRAAAGSVTCFRFWP
jgi:predicted CXXCH cytochrome family protein